MIEFWGFYEDIGIIHKSNSNINFEARGDLLSHARAMSATGCGPVTLFRVLGSSRHANSIFAITSRGSATPLKRPRAAQTGSVDQSALPAPENQYGAGKPKK